MVSKLPYVVCRQEAAHTTYIDDEIALARPWLASFFLRKGVHYQDIDDITSDAIAHAWQKRHACNSTTIPQCRAWIKVVAWRNYLMSLRRKRLQVVDFAQVSKNAREFLQ